MCLASYVLETEKADYLCVIDRLQTCDWCTVRQGWTSVNLAPERQHCTTSITAHDHGRVASAIGSG